MIRRTSLLIILCLALSLVVTACGINSNLNQSRETLPSPTTTSPVSKPSPFPSLENDSEININCTEYNPHPMGESIAEKFDASYEDVMGWYCDGFAFEDILLALQTSQLTDESPDNLLEKLANQSWEEIWKELGLINSDQ